MQSHTSFNGIIGGLDATCHFMFAGFGNVEATIVIVNKDVKVEEGRQWDAQSASDADNET